MINFFFKISENISNTENYLETIFIHKWVNFINNNKETASTI